MQEASERTEFDNLKKFNPPPVRWLVPIRVRRQISWQRDVSTKVRFEVHADSDTLQVNYQREANAALKEAFYI